MRVHASSIGITLVCQARRVQPSHQLTLRHPSFGKSGFFCDRDHSASNVACNRLHANGNERGCSHDETEYCDEERCNAEPKRHPAW
jgi:hypothetical protein